MNKFLLFIIFSFFLITENIIGQASESFDNSNPPGNTYSDGSFTGDDTFTWTYVKGRDEGSYAITGDGLMLQNLANGSKVTSASVSGGIGNFTCNLKKGFTGGGNRQVELFVNGDSQGTSIAFDNTTVQTFSVSGINIAGNVVVEIRNITTKQVVIDNISWTAFPASTNTNLSFVTNSASIAEDGTSLDVCVAIENPSATLATTVQVALDGASTATNGTDYDDGSITSTPITFPQLLTFPANSSANQCFTIHINDDVSFEGNETIILNLQNPTGGTNAELGSTTQQTITITDNDLPTIVINEIHADPDATEGDANGDGTVDTSEDEFVELYNNGASAVDLTGLTLSDGNSVRHTFPGGSVVQPGDFIVVFGGGTLSRASTSQAASSGALGLNNSGDDVTIASGGTTIATQSFGGEGGNNQSLARNPDITGGFVQHTTIATNSVRFSPGLLNTVAVLPVTYKSFEANKKAPHVHLSWQTQSEQNNDHFNIERSPDSKTWTSIGKVQGNGTTDEMKDYTYTDKNPIAGLNYYRLKQVDYDGAFEYSPLVSVDMGKETMINIYPNPVKSGEVTFEFETKQKEGTNLLIYNTNGQVVNAMTLGKDTLKVVVAVGHLADGIYSVRLVDEQTESVQRFIKQ